MPPDREPIILSIASDRRFLPLVRALIEAVCQFGGLERSVADAVILATHEAADNIIRHAHGYRADAMLQIQCCFVPEGLEISLLDEGEPFDVAAVPHLDPAELRVGGRGVYLMRSLMDELICEARGNRGNCLRMFKRCSFRWSPDTSAE